MLDEKKGEVFWLTTKWSFKSYPNVRFTLTLPSISEYQALVMLRTFFDQVKDYATGNKYQLRVEQC